MDRCTDLKKVTGKISIGIDIQREAFLLRSSKTELGGVRYDHS